MTPAPVHRGGQFLNMTIRCCVNNLLSTSCVPLVTGEAGIGVWPGYTSQTETRIPSQIVVSPGTATHNDQFVDMAIARTIGDLLGIALLPRVCSKPQHGISSQNSTSRTAGYQFIRNSPDSSSFAASITPFAGFGKGKLPPRWAKRDR